MAAKRVDGGTFASYNIGRKTEDVVKELEIRIRNLEARLLVVEPQLRLMEEYPGLKNAYNEYKLVERLIIQKEE